MTNCNKTKLKVTILNISEYIKFIKYGGKDKAWLALFIILCCDEPPKNKIAG